MHRCITVAAACLLASAIDISRSGEVRAGAGTYQIIKDEIVNAGRLRQVSIRIAQPIPESDLRTIAIRVHKIRNSPTPTTTIFVLLPEMEVNKGAWARVVFRESQRGTPEITILGQTVADQDALVNQPLPGGKVLGSWIRNLPGGSTHTIAFIRKDNGRCEAVFTYANGKGYSKALIEREPGRRYEKSPASFGEMYIINADGLLELWDEEGHIETLAKVPR